MGKKIIKTIKNEVKTKKFIELIKEKPEIYTLRQSGGHWNKEAFQLYETAWKEISSEIDWTVQECKRVWNCLRIQYNRVLQKQQNSSKPPSWPLFEDMDFFKEYYEVKKEQTIPKIKIKIKSEPMSDGENEENENNGDDPGDADYNEQTNSEDNEDEYKDEEEEEEEEIEMEEEQEEEEKSVYKRVSKKRKTSETNTEEKEKVRETRRSTRQCTTNYLEEDTSSSHSNPSIIYRPKKKKSNNQSNLSKFSQDDDTTQQSPEFNTDEDAQAVYQPIFVDVEDEISSSLLQISEVRSLAHNDLQSYEQVKNLVDKRKSSIQQNRPTIKAPENPLSVQPNKEVKTSFNENEIPSSTTSNIKRSSTPQLNKSKETVYESRDCAKIIGQAEDAEFLFLKSLLPDIKKLSKKKLRLFKRKTLDLIDDLLGDDDENDD